MIWLTSSVMCLHNLSLVLHFFSLLVSFWCLLMTYFVDILLIKYFIVEVFLGRELMINNFQIVKS